MLLCAGDIYLKLRDGDERIVFGIAEIYEFDRWAFFACPSVFGYRSVFNEKIVYFVVGFQEEICSRRSYPSYDLVYLVFFDPGVYFLNGFS